MILLYYYAYIFIYVQYLCVIRKRQEHAATGVSQMSVYVYNLIGDKKGGGRAGTGDAIDKGGKINAIFFIFIIYITTTAYD